MSLKAVPLRGATNTQGEYTLTKIGMHMSNLSFSLELAQELYNCQDPFPVDFELAWQWLGYTRKDTAKKKLIGNFHIGEDYQLRQTAEPTPVGGFSNREDIRLTVNCFKEMGMMAGTEKGRQVRHYFIECEQTLKHLVLVYQQKPRQIEPLKREQQLDALKMLFSLNERLPDDRTTITLKAHLTNLVEASQQSEPVPPMLTVTEVLEMEGIPIPSGKDSVLGRKVAKAFREIYGAEPTATAKHIGTGHRTASIKLYPQEFFERIVAIASEYFA